MPGWCSASTSLGAPSRGLHALCVRFAAGVAPGPRNTRFRLPDVPAKQRIALMAEVIERHRQALDMGDEEVRDEMFTMLVAGHETTATLVAWVIHASWRTRTS